MTYPRSGRPTNLFFAGSALLVFMAAYALEYKFLVCGLFAGLSFFCCHLLLWIGRRLDAEEFGRHAAIVAVVVASLLVALGAGAKAPDSWKRSRVVAEIPPPRSDSVLATDSSLYLTSLEAQVNDALTRASVHAKYGQLDMVEEIVRDGLVNLEGHRGEPHVEDLAVQLRRCLEAARQKQAGACKPKGA